MSVTQIYHIVMDAMQQLRPDERITRLRVSVWIIVGIYLKQAVHLRKIAGKIPGRATTNSKIRRVSRFLDNSKVNVREWYEPQARALLQAAAEARGEVRLLVDGTKVSFGHQLLMVAGGGANYGVNPTRLAPQTAAGVRAVEQDNWCGWLGRRRRAAEPYR
jgi:hypothetical protein